MGRGPGTKKMENVIGKMRKKKKEKKKLKEKYKKKI